MVSLHGVSSWLFFSEAYKKASHLAGAAGGQDSAGPSPVHIISRLISVIFAAAILPVVENLQKQTGNLLVFLKARSGTDTASPSTYFVAQSDYRPAQTKGGGEADPTYQRDEQQKSGDILKLPCPQVQWLRLSLCPRIPSKAILFTVTELICSMCLSLN